MCLRKLNSYMTAHNASADLLVKELTNHADNDEGVSLSDYLELTMLDSLLRVSVLIIKCYRHQPIF